MFDESMKDNNCLHQQVKQENLQMALGMSGVRIDENTGRLS